MDDVVFSIDIDTSVEAAWRELTKTGEVQYPMFNAVLETDWETDSPLYYYKPDRTRIFVVGRVVEVEPERRLVHTYRFTDLDETETLVTWEFEQLPSGVRVTVTHSGFTDQVATHKRVGGGWKLILATLQSILETGRKPARVRLMYGIMSALDFIQPKKTLTENVLADERGREGGLR